jgi:hypothetical protein
VEHTDCARQDIVEKLNAYLQTDSYWEDYFENADYSNLLALIRSLPDGSIPMVAWHAAVTSLKNSEDAVNLAEEAVSNQRFSDFLTQEEIDLSDLLDDVCYSEVEMLEDEDHIGAVLSDIETIESKLGVDLNFAKFESWERLEKIQNENEHEDEPLGGFLTEKQSKSDASMAYIDALFEGLVNSQISTQQFDKANQY